MARNVKISTIGVPYLPVDKSLPLETAWDNVKEHLSKQIDQVLPEKPDLIVLPEMCDLPDHYPRMGEFVDYRRKENLEFFGRIAKENKCNISFSTVTKGRGDYYLNTMCMMNRDGSVAGMYDKFYVVPNEYNWNIRCGTETPLIQMDFGKVAPVICFDLNFDDLRERYRKQKPDLVIFASMFHGGIMQQIWAQICRSYFVGSIVHSRPSAILSPMGDTVAFSTNHRNYATATVNLDYALVCLKSVGQLAEMKKVYGDGISYYDPGDIGYFLLSSERQDMSIHEMLKDFDIRYYDDYLQLSRDMHNDPKNQGIRAE